MNTKPKRKTSPVANAILLAMSIGVGVWVYTTLQSANAEPTITMSPAEAKAALQPAYDDYLDDLRMAQHSWEFKAKACKQYHYVTALARRAGDTETADRMVQVSQMRGGC